MKYFIDTEFLEGTQKETFPISLFKKETKPTIDLISIGIVSEDNREYYAISKDFNLKEAWNRFEIKVEMVYGDNRNIFPEGIKYKKYWIRENVLKPIYTDLFNIEFEGKGIKYQIENYNFTYKHFKQLINKYGKTNKQIADEIKEFTKPQPTGKMLLSNPPQIEYDNSPIQIYTYYGSYDFVVFCWLFGKMIDLPKGFPMYCMDLKQELEKLNETLGYNYDEKGKSYKLQEQPNYPKQTNEHNALADARWNKELYEFINTL
jgi:hypothetical protein